MALRFGETLTVALSTTPLMRLLESNVCRNHYRRHDPSLIPPNGMVPEEQCKVAEVQETVSNLNGVASILSLIPALLAALPYVFVSRAVSKKKTLLLNVVGGVLANIYFLTILYFYNTFDPRWTWLNGIFSFIGGGDLIYYTLLEALIAESVTHDSLSSFYLYSSAVSLLLKIAGSSVSLSLMPKSLVLPVLVSIATKMSGLPIILGFIRDAQDTTSMSDSTHFEAVPVDESEIPISPSQKAASTTGGILGFLKNISQKNDVARRAVIPLVLCSLQEVGNSFRVIAPYWLSTRFHWSLRNTGWVKIGEMLLTALVLAAVPRFSRIIRRDEHDDGTSSRGHDWVAAYLSLCFSCLGTLLLGLSWHRLSGIVSIVVLTGGAAFRDTYLGYITADLAEEDITEVYILLSIVSLSAFSVGGWVVAGINSFALHMEESWETGLPLWTCSLFFFLAVIVLKRSRRDDGERSSIHVDTLRLMAEES